MVGNTAACKTRSKTSHAHSKSGMARVRKNLHPRQRRRFAFPAGCRGESPPLNDELFKKYRATTSDEGNADRFDYQMGIGTRPCDFEFRHKIDLLEKMDFLPLPPSGMVIEHPQITMDGRGRHLVEVKVTSGQPGPTRGSVGVW